MVSVDSEAVFQERLTAMGLTELKEMFADRGWKTLASFAFACSFVPGAPGGDDKVCQEKVVLKLVTSEDSPLVPSLRRLYFEAYTTATADLKRLEGPCVVGASPGQVFRRVSG